jgi:hypothetical protein
MHDSWDDRWRGKGMKRPSQRVGPIFLYFLLLTTTKQRHVLRKHAFRGFFVYRHVDYVVIIRVVHGSHFWLILGSFSNSFLVHFDHFGCKQIKMKSKMKSKMAQKWLPWNPWKAKVTKMKQKCILHVLRLCWQCSAHSNSTSKHLTSFFLASAVHGPAWPESPGFGLARGGFGFVKPQARPKPQLTAWLRLGLAQAAAFEGKKIYKLYVILQLQKFYM